MIHHHGCRGGRATRRASVGPVVVGELAQVVERSILSPQGSHQRSVGHSTQFRLGVRRPGNLQIQVLMEEVNLFFVLVQDLHHGGGEIVDVIQGRITHHQNLLGTVITSNHKECR